jgi:hypothetical protein
VTNLIYHDKLRSSEVKNCSGMKLYDRDRGATIVATSTVLVDRDGYEIYDFIGEQDGRIQTREHDFVVRSDRA